MEQGFRHSEGLRVGAGIVDSEDLGALKPAIGAQGDGGPIPVGHVF